MAANPDSVAQPAAKLESSGSSRSCQLQVAEVLPVAGFRASPTCPRRLPPRIPLNSRRHPPRTSAAAAPAAGRDAPASVSAAFLLYLRGHQAGNPQARPAAAIPDPPKHPPATAGRVCLRKPRRPPARMHFSTPGVPGQVSPKCPRRPPVGLAKAPLAACGPDSFEDTPGGRRSWLARYSGKLQVGPPLSTPGGRRWGSA